MVIIPKDSGTQLSDKSGYTDHCGVIYREESSLY